MWLCKMAMSDSQWYTWTVFLSKHLCGRYNDIFVFLGLKVYFSNSSFIFFCSRNAQLPFVEKPQLKITSFQNHKHPIHTWLDKALSITVVHRALWRVTEITRTVSLTELFYFRRPVVKLTGEILSSRRKRDLWGEEVRFRIHKYRDIVR